MRRLLPAVLLALGAALPARAGEDRAELARKIAAVLTERGYPIDAAKLRIEERSSEEMEKDIREQQRLFFGPSYFEGFARFYRALSPELCSGDPASFDGKALMDAAVQSISGSVSAYYQPGADRLVFRKVDGEAGLMAFVVDQRHLVAHEFVHAYQDRVRNMTAGLKEAQKSLESVRAFSCLIEGEAELVAISTRTDLAKVQPMDLSPELERILRGEVQTMVYSTGRTFMMDRWREGGWKAVAEVFERRPASTEQILHREKFPKDLPTEVGLPDSDLPTIHEDVVGEFEIYRLLLLLGASRDDAWEAAAGWDGDRLRVLGSPDKGEVILWKTLWDRPVDAEQFSALLSAEAKGRITVRDRAVCWSSGSTPELADRATRLLGESAAPPPVVPEDAASTEAMEATWKSSGGTGPTRSGDDWIHSAAGVRVPIPKGWTLDRIQGVPALFDKASGILEGFAPNVNIQTLPLPAGKDLDALLEQNRGIGSVPGLTLDFIERTDLGGTPAFHYAFHGTVKSGGRELRFLGVVFIHRGRQVVVTASTTENLWDSQKAMLKKTIAGIRVVVEAPPAEKK